MPQQLSPASRQTQAHGYKNICIKRGKGQAGHSAKGEALWCPETYVPHGESLIKNKEAGKGDVRGEKSCGGLRAGGRGQAGWEPPAAFRSGTPQFLPCPGFPLPDPGAPGPRASIHSSFWGSAQGPTRLR